MPVVVTDLPQPGSGGILSAEYFQRYDIDLNFTDDAPTDTPAPYPGILAALQEQLGLKLEPKKALFDMFHDIMPGSGIAVNYLEANRGGTKFLVAVSSSQQADSIIIQTGEPVMAASHSV